ncbi:MAG: pyruvate kinase, partial [Bacteroidetes bacterium]|nr:pyruvate kinase [Bacteroidota bacterium]
MSSLGSTRAKIICTLGPSSSDYEMIRKMIDAGMDVARLNFSHGSHEMHLQVIHNIRKASAAAGRAVAILQDLQGPKIRVGTFGSGETELRPGQRFTITNRQVVGDNTVVSTTYQELPNDVKTGDSLLIDDGLLRLRVIEKSKEDVVCEVAVGGKLKNNKGINLPGVSVSSPSLTEKDHADLLFGLEHGVDYVALSFVRKPEDILTVKEIIRSTGRMTPVVAKIEKPEALECIDRIIAISDAIMVARGDLGVEMKTEEVPPIQKRLISLCNKAGVPVITATQMLDSMIYNPRPTRAEASDVANAILDGTDAVMLSAETAAGQFPVRAVATMHRIINQVEGDEHYLDLMDAARLEPEHTSPGAITAAARQVAHTLEAAAIVTFTSSGSTTLRAARERPGVPILCITPSMEAGRRLGLVWGVHAVVGDFIDSVEDIGDVAVDAAVTSGIGQEGQALVITAGMPFGTPGATNMLRI